MKYGMKSPQTPVSITRLVLTFSENDLTVVQIYATFYFGSDTYIRIRFKLYRSTLKMLRKC